MDALTFIATMTGNLAWPVVATGIFILFRKPILKRLPYLTKATWGDKSIEFTDRLEDAAEKVIQLPESEQPLALPAPDKELEESAEQFESALSASPNLAVLQSWLPIEGELQRVARLKGYSTDRTRSPTYTMRQLQSDGTLLRQDAELIKELFALRNIAAHSPDATQISTDGAKEYRTLAEVLLQRLRSIS